MRNQTFIFLLALLSFSASAIKKPTLAKSFNSTYSFYVPLLSAPYIHGNISVDYTNGGGRMEVRGAQLLPVYLNTTLITHPINSTTVSAYAVHNRACWIIGYFPTTWMNLYPLEIPASARFAGNGTLNGDLYSRWDWQEYDYFLQVEEPIEIWAKYKDNSVAKFMVPFLITDFPNMKVTKIDPSVYDIPKLNCTPSPYGLLREYFNFMDIFLNLPHYFKTSESLQSPEKKYQKDAPPIPTLPTQYYTHFQLHKMDSNNSDYIAAYGSFAVDSKSGGGAIFFGDEAVPQQYQVPLQSKMKLLGSPVEDKVTMYLYGGDSPNAICWLGAQLNKDWMINTFPLQIPSNADYVGNRIVKGRHVNCWKWSGKFGIYVSGEFEIWVAADNNDVVRLYVNGNAVIYSAGFYFDCFNQRQGPVDNSHFKEPRSFCFPMLPAPSNQLISYFTTVIKNSPLGRLLSFLF